MTRHYGDTLNTNWVDKVAGSVERYRSPKIFMKWAAIHAVATAMGRKCWFGSIHPNMFILLVGGSRSGKSSAIDFVYDNFVTPLTLGLNENSGPLPSYKRYGLDQPIRIQRGPITWGGIIENMSEISEKDKDIRHLGTPSDPFYQSSYSIITNEFGEQMRSNDFHLQAVMTSLWDSTERFQYDTKTAGKYLVKGPCLSWIAGVTPSVLRTNMPADAHKQGLLNRMVMVYSDPIPLIAFGDEIDSRLKELLVQDLARIASMRGEFTISDEAKDAHIWWVEQEQCEPYPKDVLLDAYTGNRVLLVLKLAMIFSATRNDSRIIELQDWERAKRELEEVETKMPQALQEFGVSDHGQVLQDVTKALFHKYDMQPFSAMALAVEIAKVQKHAGQQAQIAQELEAMKIIEWVNDKKEQAVLLRRSLN